MSRLTLDVPGVVDSSMLCVISPGCMPSDSLMLFKYSKVGEDR